MTACTRFASRLEDPRHLASIAFCRRPVASVRTLCSATPGRPRGGARIRGHPRGLALTRAVLELTEGIGAQHAFVCADPPATLLSAFRATAKARTVVVTALSPDEVTRINIPPLELLVS